MTPATGRRVRSDWRVASATAKRWNGGAHIFPTRLCPALVCAKFRRCRCSPHTKQPSPRVTSLIGLTFHAHATPRAAQPLHALPAFATTRHTQHATACGGWLPHFNHLFPSVAYIRIPRCRFFLYCPPTTPRIHRPHILYLHYHRSLRLAASPLFSNTFFICRRFMSFAFWLHAHARALPYLLLHYLKRRAGRTVGSCVAWRGSFVLVVFMDAEPTGEPRIPLDDLIRGSLPYYTA